MIDYPDEEDVLTINREILGSASVLRDPGLLSSAVFRPQSGFGGEEVYPDIWLKATALAEGIARNHPFIDGNKRTAWESARLFLAVNGVVPVEGTLTDDRADNFILSLVEGLYVDTPKAAEALRQLFL